METKDVQLQGEADITFLLLLQLHKTSAAIQSVCWATSTLLISAVMSTAQLRNMRFETGRAKLSRRESSGHLRGATSEHSNDSESGVK